MVTFSSNSFFIFDIYSNFLFNYFDIVVIFGDSWMMLGDTCIASVSLYFVLEVVEEDWKLQNIAQYSGFGVAGNESDCDVRRVPELSAKTGGGVPGLSHTQDKGPTGSSHRKRGGASADKEHKRLKRFLIHLFHVNLVASP